MKTKRSKTALIKARVGERTKALIERAADSLEMDQSTMIRVALMEYIERHTSGNALINA